MLELEKWRGEDGLAGSEKGLRTMPCFQANPYIKLENGTVWPDRRVVPDLEWACRYDYKKLDYADFLVLASICNAYYTLLTHVSKDLRIKTGSRMTRAINKELKAAKYRQGAK